jgi:phenylacetate-coenzyme A ligase PaaK-like adenylate-forming protein
MNIQEKMQHIADEVKQVETWAKANNNSYWYNEYVSRIETKLRPIREFAKFHKLPFTIDAETIADKNYDDTDGYSEEESSSSYYEEDYSSDYDESEYEEDESSEW